MPLDRSDLLSILEACKDEPEDDTPRLILADWLREQGDEDRGNFVQLQVEAARLPPDDPQRRERETQASGLLEAHRAEWLGPLVHLQAGAEFSRGLIRMTVWASALQAAAASWTEAWAWV